MSSFETEIDAALTALHEHRDAWAGLDPAGRIAILDELNADLRGVADRWVQAGLEAKGLTPGSPAAGEEWIYLAAVFRIVRQLRQTLAEIRAGGRPRVPRGLTTRPDGQIVARVFPRAVWEQVFFARTEAEVWMEPGLSAAEVSTDLAPLYRRGARAPQAGVTALLGAGNVSALVPSDLLHLLFVEGRVVALKMNPVNAYLGPLIEEGFRALIRRGFLRVLQGGAREGDYLCRHPRVDAIHMTGSDKTFEAITFGPGPEGARRKAERTPLLDKPFSAELGNVSPIIVVPGPWTTGEVRAQARRIASWLVNNAGFNCLTPRVLIQAADWPQRDALVGELERALAVVETRRAYYPGAMVRHAAFLAEHPHASQLGSAPAGNLPWTLIRGVDPARRDSICFREEAFCALMAETALPAASAPEFVDRAVAHANEVLWGTLVATIIVHPRSLADPALAGALDRALVNLRYGTVVINNYGGLAYYLALAPWGAAPGHDRYDIQSGIGWVNNTLMLHRPHKSVVRCPFTQLPDPTVVSSTHFGEFGRRLALFEAKPSAWEAPGVLMSAIRG